MKNHQSFMIVRCSHHDPKWTFTATCAGTCKNSLKCSFCDHDPIMIQNGHLRLPVQVLAKVALNVHFAIMIDHDRKMNI